MIASAYFAYHYIKARKNLPVRGSDLKTSLSNYHEHVAREGKIAENKLYDSEEYKQFEREKLRDKEKEGDVLREEDDEFLRELEEKET